MRANCRRGARPAVVLVLRRIAHERLDVVTILRPVTTMFRLIRNRSGDSIPLTSELKGAAVSLGTILLIFLVLLLLGALPAWPYSSGWGYYPSGGLGLVLIVLLILVATGRM